MNSLPDPDASHPLTQYPGRPFVPATELPVIAPAPAAWADPRTGARVAAADLVMSPDGFHLVPAITPPPKPVDWNRWIAVGVAVLVSVLSSLGVRFAWPSLPAIPPEVAAELKETRAELQAVRVQQAETVRVMRAAGVPVPPAQQ